MGQRLANDDANKNGEVDIGLEANEIHLTTGPANNEETLPTAEITNEYVLNFAFISFVVFTCLQFIFALAAQSQSMLTDCAAMTVDCVSYLINFMAERLKHKAAEHNNSQHRLSSYERHYRKKMRLLLLELAPPLLSVATLIAVTVIAIDQAISILLDSDPNDDNKGPQPNLFLMLLFSSLNFVLDGVNMTCFARADHAQGLSDGITAAMHPQEYVHEKEVRHQLKNQQKNAGCCNNCHQPQQPSQPAATTREVVATETTHLLLQQSSDYVVVLAAPPPGAGKGTTTVATAESDEEDDLTSDSSQSSRSGLNLNMCSAWTHVCADTLRSIAVLVAAGFAWLFPNILTPADADSYGAIVVSIIIIFSLAPLIEGLYFTAWEIYHLYRDHQRRTRYSRATRDGEEDDDPMVSLSV